MSEPTGEWVIAEIQVALQEAVARIGRDRLILCRCDSPEALRVGRTMGISLYQGRYFDALLEEARTRADEVEPAKAVPR